MIYLDAEEIIDMIIILIQYYTNCLSTSIIYEVSYLDTTIEIISFMAECVVFLITIILVSVLVSSGLGISH